MTLAHLNIEWNFTPKYFYRIGSIVLFWSIISMFVSQMAMLGFFRNSSLLPPPRWLVKHTKALANKHYVRESAHSGKRKKERMNKKKMKKLTEKTPPCSRDLNPWILSPEPATITIRPQRPASSTQKITIKFVAFFFIFQPFAYPRSYSAMAREYDPLSDTLGMDNSRSYLGGRSLSGPDGMASLRDTAITGNSLDAEDRHRYLASRRFVGDYGLWKSLNKLSFTASAATTTATTTMTTFFASIFFVLPS